MLQHHREDVFRGENIAKHSQRSSTDLLDNTSESQTSTGGEGGEGREGERERREKERERGREGEREREKGREGEIERRGREVRRDVSVGV